MWPVRTFIVTFCGGTAMKSWRQLGEGVLCKVGKSWQRGNRVQFWPKIGERH